MSNHSVAATNAFHGLPVEETEPVCQTHGIPAWEHTEPCTR